MATKNVLSNKPATKPEISGPPMAESPTINNPSTETRVKIKSHIKVYVSLLMAIIVVVGLVFGFLAYQNQRKNAQAVAKTMISAIIKNDSTTAYSVTSATFKSSTTASQLATSISQISPYLQGAKYQLFDHYNWVKNSQVVSTSLVYKLTAGQKTYYIRLLLDKDQKGVWKVSVFRIRETELKALEG